MTRCIPDQGADTIPVGAHLSQLSLYVISSLCLLECSSSHLAKVYGALNIGMAKWSFPSASIGATVITKTLIKRWYNQAPKFSPRSLNSPLMITLVGVGWILWQKLRVDLFHTIVCHIAHTQTVSTHVSINSLYLKNCPCSLLIARKNTQ